MSERFSDADLVAFLDGCLDDGTNEAIAGALLTDSALNKRLDALVIDGGAELGADGGKGKIAEAFKPLLDQAPAYRSPSQLAGSGVANLDRQRRKTATVSKPVNPWWAAGIGAVAASLLLGLVVTTILPRGFGSWQNYAASYHLLYITETLDEAVVDTARSTLIAEKLGFDLSRVVDIGDEFAFKRAQILGFEGEKILQLAYLANDGQPMAFCLMRRASADQSNVAKTMHQIATSQWSEGPFEYVALGGANDAQLARFTQELRARL